MEEAMPQQTAAMKSIERKIETIKKKILNLGGMHPGSLSKQYNICGNPTCRCKDPENPRKHGPYYQLSFVHRGKSSSRFIKKEFVPDVKAHLSNYKKFKQLVDDWKGLATDLAKMRFDEAKKIKEKA